MAVASVKEPFDSSSRFRAEMIETYLRPTSTSAKIWKTNDLPFLVACKDIETKRKFTPPRGHEPEPQSAAAELLSACHRACNRDALSLSLRERVRGGENPSREITKNAP